MVSNLAASFAQAALEISTTSVLASLSSLVQPERYVGEVFSIGYESALVQVHDYHRQRVGGIPSLSFLVASRPFKALDGSPDPLDEDTAVILLRVMDAAALPNEAEALRIRVESAQRVSGELTSNWDDSTTMDAYTNNLLSFAGLKCRVLGTFYIAPSSDSEDDLAIRFGSDISNFYPNRGLKVYKPVGSALEQIVNFREHSRERHQWQPVIIGKVRYASTNRTQQGVDDVPVRVIPEDMISQKTALFGMTRTGKSNTTKIILQSLFRLRFEPHSPLRIGQLVFDPNGEYANENVQDNSSAIKNVWRTSADGVPEDVVTYGLEPHPNDPQRRIMRLNFFEDSNLQLGKEIIDSFLADSTSIYIKNFLQLRFEDPGDTDYGQKTRHKRRVLAYRALLATADFEVPPGTNPEISGLFGKEFLDALESSSHPDCATAATILKSTQLSWSRLSIALKGIAAFIEGGQKTGFDTFNNAYAQKHQGDSWADEDLKRLLGMFLHGNGPKQIGRARPFHSRDTNSDFAADIYSELVKGHLVIVDQATGDPEVNSTSADRIMQHIFFRNQEVFRRGQVPPSIIVYIEEAHNVLPEGSEKNLQNIWVRTAKEGAKYNLGLTYATQEVSSIQKNILKNTSNWFIGHLNNSDETRELCKYYDFDDFEGSIRRAQDRGFLRVKTLSNRFVIPVQIDKFSIELPSGS